MTRCPFPGKKPLTRKEAAYQAGHINTHNYDGSPVRPYHCPVGGHWHVGHRPPTAATRRSVSDEQALGRTGTHLDSPEVFEGDQ